MRPCRSGAPASRVLDAAAVHPSASSARGRRRVGATSATPITMSVRVAVATASTQPGASRKYAGRMKFVGVAVSVNQSPEKVKAYAEKHGMAYDVLLLPARSSVVPGWRANQPAFSSRIWLAFWRHRD